MPHEARSLSLASALSDSKLRHALRCFDDALMMRGLAIGYLAQREHHDRELSTLSTLCCRMLVCDRDDLCALCLLAAGIEGTCRGGRFERKRCREQRGEQRLDDKRLDDKRLDDKRLDD